MSWQPLGSRWPRAPRRVLCASLLVLGAANASAQPGSKAPEDGTPTPAGADAAPADGRVVELNERGSALYADGDYRRAVELFLQAYAVDGDPNLLFNIAACYEGLGDRDAAIEKYRAFLADPNADPDGRPRAESAIERLLAPPSDETPPAPIPVAPSPAPTPAPDAARAAGPAPKQLPEWLPWAVLGGGGALAVAGASIYLWGVADHREVTEAPGYDDPRAVVQSSRAHAEALVHSGNIKKVVGASTAAFGGVMIAGYVLWQVLERPDEVPAPQLDIAVSPSAASISWAARF